jgi:hypothetical protein
VPDLELNGQKFKDLQELKCFVFHLLQNYPNGSQVSETHLKFLVALFSHHPNAYLKLPNLTRISVGVHKKGENETKCFIIEKDGEKSDISYIKAINGFLQFSISLAESESLNKFQNVVNQVIEILVKVLRDSPLLINSAKEEIRKQAPHKSMETKYLKFYMKNLLVITEKIPGLLQFSLNHCMEKLIEIESLSDKDKFDQVACNFFCFVHKNYSPSLFKHILEVFSSHILSTSQVLYIHHLILNLCEKSQTNTELFLSVLIKSMFFHRHVQAASSYLASFLLIYPSLTCICVKYMIYYCLKNCKIDARLNNVKHVLKYVIFLVAYKKELWKNEKICEKLTKVVKKIDGMKGLALQEGLEYEELVETFGFQGELCLTNIFLPFHSEVPEFKMISIYFNVAPLFFREKKRKRCMSTDIPSSMMMKRRAFSIDESKLFDRIDTASITTVGSSKYLTYE